jgi:hypothetical protein
VNDKEVDLMRMAIYAAGLVIRYGKVVVFSQGLFVIGFLYGIGLCRLLGGSGGHNGAFTAALVVSFISLGIYELIRCAPKAVRKEED